MESQMQAASSDWTNVIIPGSDTFVPGEQQVRSVLIIIKFTTISLMASGLSDNFDYAIKKFKNLYIQCQNQNLKQLESGLLTILLIRAIREKYVNKS